MSLAVIGATSIIARHTTAVFSEAGHDIFLVARNIGSLKEFKSEICSAEVAVDMFQADISNIEMVPSVADQVIQSLGENPYVLIAVGSISKQNEAKVSSKDATYLINVNFRNIVALITPIAQALEQKGNGCLIIISSVAGDRGRQSNYIYGSAKAGLSVYAQGLRNRLHSSGVHVLTVKPGYVDTPMLRQALGRGYNDTPRIVIGNPSKVARRIYSAAVKKKNVIYVPPIWRFLMLLVKSIPEWIFKKMGL